MLKDRRKEGAGEVEIAPRLLARCCGWLRGSRLRPQQLDLGSDRRPRRKKQRQRRKSNEIGRASLTIEIRVEHGVGVRCEVSLAEIHQQKGEIVENVDGR